MRFILTLTTTLTLTLFAMNVATKANAAADALKAKQHSLEEAQTALLIKY